jgi:hypothetical protein
MGEFNSKGRLPGVDLEIKPTVSYDKLHPDNNKECSIPNMMFSGT